MRAVEGQHAPFAAVVVPMAPGRRSKVLYVPAALLSRVRLAVPDPADRSARRCSIFLPLPPSSRGYRPIWDVLPDVM